MPIARIITSMPELSGGLVRDLNSRGFEVHIISPEQTPSGTADLEIRLEAISHPAGVEVRASAIPASTTAVPELAASRPALPQPPLQQQEDIWTMLASFDGDAATQDVTTDITAANGNQAETGFQEVIATMHALSENSAQRSETAEDVPSGTPSSVTQRTANPVDREHVDSLSVDPDLVPSMFNFSSSGENAEAEQESATSSNRSPWRGSELRKTNLRSRDSRSPRVAAAAGCAVFVILMVLTFAHSHAAPKATNSPAQETRTTAPFHSVGPSAETVAQPTVPIKPAVLVTSVSSPSKAARRAPATETAIAEDTIVRYGSKKKTPEASPKKPTAIRYYSDMD
jgi:hypothetical protein